jgi:hypothetical protein
MWLIFNLGMLKRVKVHDSALLPLFPFVFFFQSCTLRGGNYLKDLTLVEPDLAKVCIVDNSPMAYILNSGM